MNTYIFPNKFKMIYEPVGHSIPLTSIFIYIKFGSIHETKPEYKGIAHFIEHMCFKGTKSLNPIEIVHTYDEIGAFLNAETSKQYTCYKIRCGNEHVAHSIQVLSDIIMNSVFKSHEMDLERHVVFEEVLRSDHDPYTQIDDTIYKNLYAGSPYSDPIDTISYHKNPHSLKTSDVLEMYHRFYQPQNMGISIVSNLSFESVKKMIRSSAFMKKLVDNHVSYVTLVPSIITPTRYILNHKKGVQATNISVSFRTCPYGHKDMYALFLLKNIIGGYMSSRHFMTLREKWGLTYTSKCNIAHHSSSGHFEFYTMSAPNNVISRNKNPGVLSLIFDIIDDLIVKGITEKELHTAKGNFKGKFILGLEESQIKCIHNGIEFILYDKPEIIPYEKMFEKLYEPVTKKEINELVRRYFRPDNMLVCLVGEDLPNLKSVQRVCEYRR